ncbi:MAG: hypothetical protein KDB80_05475 [Planctomycetes bacterium]|nr:hypothetical protein [Planctomycetota bacterium]
MRGRSAFLVLCLSLTSSCAAVRSLTANPLRTEESQELRVVPRPFGGTTLNLGIVFGRFQWEGTRKLPLLYRTISVLDLLPSLALDAVLLPVTVGQQFAEGSWKNRWDPAITDARGRQ